MSQPPPPFRPRLPARPRRRAGAAIRFLAAAAVAILPACGRKTAIKPPELVAPAAIDSLAAGNAADGIQLSWRRPQTYVDGSRMTDLGAFRVDRAVGDGPFAPVATIAVTDQERIQQERRFRWLDRETAIGQTYLYRVFSQTTDGYRSSGSNLVAIAREMPSPPPTAAATPPATPTP